MAADLSQNMLEEARSHLASRFGGRVEYVRADLASLPFDEAFDGVFSTAAFHWVPDHPRLFRGLYDRQRRNALHNIAFGTYDAGQAHFDALR